MIGVEMLAGLLPVAIKGIQSIGGRLADKVLGVAPKTPAEALDMAKMQIEKLKALAVLDSGKGTASQWVIDLRQSSRYVMGFAIIGAYIYFYNDATIDSDKLGSLASAVMFFLYGERVEMKRGKL